MKQLEDLNKNFQEQQKQRLAEMDNYKKEIAVLHEKNAQSAINEKTALLRSDLETLQKDNIRLDQEVQHSKNNYVKGIMIFLVALVAGFLLARML